MMVSDISPISTGMFVFLLVWLAIVTYFLYRYISHYNKLTTTSDRKSLQSILSNLLDTVQAEKQNAMQIQKKVKDLETAMDFTLQKVSLLRFNPFADTGGEQSFIIGLLDRKNNGILITSLQGRSGTRWYAKRVAGGSGVKYDLSKEEKEAVKKAKPLT